MPHSLFISDLHLDINRPGTLRAFASYLANNRDCEQLYILGDLFEAWVGDDDDAPLAQQVTTLLRDFSAAGPQLFLMNGNRDFLLGQALCEKVGARLLQDPTIIDLYGERVLLMHGDTLCTADTDYQAFRETARSPAWQADLLSRPLEERREIAASLRAMSKESSSNKAMDIMDVTPDEVDRQMQAHGVNTLIHGHTHRPAVHNVKGGKRWVLGDWEDYGWEIRAQPGSLKSNKFKL